MSGDGVKTAEESGKRRSLAEDGFTLIELVIFTFIMLLLVAGVLTMLSGAFRSSAATYDLTQVEDAAREALSAMTRQLRVATALNAASTGQSLTICGDMDGNGVAENVTFTASSGSLCRNGEQWVSHVDQITFTYYESGRLDTAITPGSSGWNTRVGRVSIVIELSGSEAGKDPIRTYEASVALRNSMT